MEPFDLTNIPDHEEFVCIIYNQDHSVYSSLEFTIFGNEPSYNSLTYTWENKTVFFKQHVYNTTYPYKGEVFSRYMWDENHANFVKCELTIKNTKFTILTERNSFNRIVTIDNKGFRIIGSSVLTSNCFIWGGIYLFGEYTSEIDISSSELIITNDDQNSALNRPLISNANVAICFPRNVQTRGGRENKTSTSFPFYEDINTTSRFAAMGYINIINADFKNNYFHFYTMAPIKIGEITKCNFDCNPDLMLYPYQPREITQGVWKKTITEAAIVGHPGLSAQFFGPTNANISGNNISNALYGILMPNISLQGYNYWKNISLIGVQNYGTIFNSTNIVVPKISNQEIIFSLTSDENNQYSEQINNLSSY